MSHVHHEVAFEAAQEASDPAVTACGLTVSLTCAAGTAYLLVSSVGPGEPLALLLPAATHDASGLSVFSRLGRLHARPWAVVWGVGAPPATGVGFSTGDLRFRRETRSGTVGVGYAWFAIADGVFREATVDPDGPVPRWLLLAQSR